MACSGRWRSRKRRAQLFAGKLLRTGKVRGMRFSTLAAVCGVLGCVPGDLLDYEPNPDDVHPLSGALDD